MTAETVAETESGTQLGTEAEIQQETEVNVQQEAEVEPKPKKSKKKIVLIVLACILVLAIGGLWTVSVVGYNDTLGARCETYEPLASHIEDFEGLQRTRYEFASDKGQKLVGYLYSSGTNQKGILVIAHGYGAGHNFYMDVANYFAQNGYYVFAYDATGNDESEGEGVGGLPQGPIDLEHAISFLEANEDIPDLPIVLFGHSWGAYSACSVLTYHPEVKAVIECSGANRSSDYVEAMLKGEMGDACCVVMPFINLHELMSFGKYATNSSMAGFDVSDAAIMVVHSEDDEVVPIQSGYDVYYEKYSNDPRFTFVHLEDAGHSYVFDDMTYINEFNAGFDEWKASLDYDYKAEENNDRFAEEKADYINSHLDRQKWNNKLNKELFEQFLSFYNEAIQR